MIYTEKEYYSSDERKEQGMNDVPESFTYRNAKVSFKDSGDKVTMYIEHGDYIFEETYSEEELDQNPLSKENIEDYIDQYLASEQE